MHFCLAVFHFTQNTKWPFLFGKDTTSHPFWTYSKYYCHCSQDNRAVSLWLCNLPYTEDFYIKKKQNIELRFMKNNAPNHLPTLNTLKKPNFHSLIVITKKGFNCVQIHYSNCARVLKNSVVATKTDCEYVTFEKFYSKRLPVQNCSIETAIMKNGNVLTCLALCSCFWLKFLVERYWFSEF